MKKVIFFLPFLLISATLMAQPPKGKAKKGTVYGASVDKTGAISADQLPALLQGKETAQIKIEGEVTEVCQAMGCWMKIKTADGPVMVKMKDHAFYVPLALIGKKVVLEGEASVKETSVEMLRHYAEDAGKSKEEIEAINAPQRQIMVMASGIRVL
jgi:hypothetical protein